MRCIALSVALVVLVAASAGAEQEPVENPVADAPIRLGILALGPRLAVTNLGVDTNVFNSVSDPEKDFTITGRPSLNLWLRTQKGLLSINGGLDLVYYQKFESERSVNGIVSAEYEYRFNRIRPFFSFDGLNTRERPGFEIDVRARRFENVLTAGVDVRVASKSYIALSGRRQQVNYAGDAVFAGRPMNQALNRTLEAVDLTWRQRLTVLTTWIVRASGERERFEFEQLRNADSTRISSGFELGRLALIRGHAFVGYRRLVGADGGAVPEFSGITADANIAYNAPTQTRLALTVARDVQYSFELVNPYYVQTGWTATLTQRIMGPWDLQLLGGRARLSYQGPRPVLFVDERRDRIDRVGGGIGYQLGQDVRFSFDVESLQRQSELPGRDYKALRAGASVTYGF